jgi:hypothetical protein
MRLSGATVLVLAVGAAIFVAAFASAFWNADTGSGSAQPTLKAQPVGGLREAVGIPALIARPIVAPPPSARQIPRDEEEQPFDGHPATEEGGSTAPTPQPTTPGPNTPPAKQQDEKQQNEGVQEFID